MRRAVGRVHRETLRAAMLDKLETQTALAESRLTDYPHDLAVTGARP